MIVSYFDWQYYSIFKSLLFLTMGDGQVIQQNRECRIIGPQKQNGDSVLFLETIGERFVCLLKLMCKTEDMIISSQA